MRLPISDAQAIPLAVAAVSRGELVVIPTDTVYGVACSPFDAAAIARIYELKQRPQEKALQVLLADFDDALKVAVEITPLARTLAGRFWPGALTLTLPKRPDLPVNLSTYDTIAVRIPGHEDCRALIRAAGGALAATSANISAAPNPTTVQMAAGSFGAAVALYLDGGATGGAEASTVVDLRGDAVVVLREGAVTRALLARVLREAGYSGGVINPADG